MNSRLPCVITMLCRETERVVLTIPKVYGSLFDVMSTGTIRNLSLDWKIVTLRISLSKSGYFLIFSGCNEVLATSHVGCSCFSHAHKETWQSPSK